MDPFSLSVGIAGLVGLIGTTIKLANGYVSGVKQAKSSISMLIHELDALQSNLASLDQFLHSGSAKSLVFEHTSVLRTCSTACESKLKLLHNELARKKGDKLGRYLWPLSEKEHQKTIQELRAFSQWMHFALSVDGCSLLARTSDDVLECLGQQLESFRALQGLRDTTTELEGAVRDQTRLLQDGRDAKKREAILNWISPLEHNQKHHAVQSARTEGSGGWLLNRAEFARWGDDTDAPRVLWCHGLQGSGKTVLTHVSR